MGEIIILGINRTQDASVALIDRDGVLCSVQKERLTRVKHHWGKLGDLRDYSACLPISDRIDLAIECYSSDTEIARIDAYHGEMRSGIMRKQGEIYQISHHLAHLYSAYFPSGLKSSAGMIIDFQGSQAKNFTEKFTLPGGFDQNCLEVASFYDCEDRTVRCIAKQLWDGDPTKMVGLGAFYQSLTRLIFPRSEGQEGKVMGLAPLGNPNAMDLPPLLVRDHEVFIPDAWLEVFCSEKNDFLFEADDQERFERSANLAAVGQRAFEDALLKLSTWLRAEVGKSSLCYAGGCALNCSANAKLISDSGFKEIFIPPAAGDGGTSIGCAVYGQVEILKQACSFRWTESDFLGPESSTLNDWQEHSNSDFVVDCPPDLPGAVAALLEEQCVVAIFEGRSEMGPRSLGHRSIVADPRNDEMRTWINMNVKGRETYRPLAPAVLEERATEYFEVDRRLMFMQFAIRVRPSVRQLIPAVVHVDGTARVQMIQSEMKSAFRAIIERFAARTGIPLVINTSFNGKEEPIVETVSDALMTFRATALHALVIPPFLILKRNRLPTWRGRAL